MSYFIVAANNRWGHHEYDLIKALENAELRQHTLAELQASYLEEVLSEDGRGAKLALQESKHSFKRDYLDESDQPDDLVDFTAISPVGEWKFSEVDPINGSPSYEWVGEGDKPDQLEVNKLNLTFNKRTGEITLR